MPSTPDINVSALAEALNNKLDVDGYNFSSSLKAMLGSLNMPNTNNYFDISAPTNSGQSLTIGHNGWLCISGQTTANYGVVRLQNSHGFGNGQCMSTGNTVVAMIPVTSGDMVIVGWNAVSNLAIRLYLNKYYQWS